MPPPQTLQEYLAQHSTSSNTQGVVAFPAEPDSYNNLRYYTNNEINAHVQTALHHYLDLGIHPAPNTESIAGIYAPGTIEWFVTAIALSRLGYTLLALSRSLSDEVLSALLDKANCTLLITDDTSLPKQHTSTFSSPPSKTSVTTHPIIPLSTLLSPPPHVRSLHPVLSIAPTPTTAFIWHSSGSTGIPKLLPMAQTITISRLTSANATFGAKSKLWIASGAYNSAGLTFLLGSLSKEEGGWTAFFNDRLPYTGAGLCAFLTDLVAAGLDRAIFTAATLEMVIEQKGGVELLKKIPTVSTFGAVLPQELGDRVVKEEGIGLSVGYAMSETSNLMNSVGREEGDLDWDYMWPATPLVKEHSWFKPLVIREESIVVNGGERREAEQLYELVILKGYPNCSPKFSNSDDPPGSFYTGDVFVKHPTKEDRWKIVGRKDDQINMGFPCVVNAHDYEEAIMSGCSRSEIEEVVLVGQGRKKLGLLVFVSGQNGINEKQIQQTVWKVVQEKVNADKSFKLQVEESMIRAIRGSVPRTDKLNFMRAAVSRRYVDVIDSMYQEEC